LLQKLPHFLYEITGAINFVATSCIVGLPTNTLTVRTVEKYCTYVDRVEQPLQKHLPDTTVCKAVIPHWVQQHNSNCEVISMPPKKKEGKAAAGEAVEGEDPMVLLQNYQKFCK
jgi:uncharacterized membrane protein